MNTLKVNLVLESKDLRVIKSTELRDLIFLMLKNNPEERPNNLDEVLNSNVWSAEGVIKKYHRLIKIYCQLFHLGSLENITPNSFFNVEN